VTSILGIGAAWTPTAQAAVQDTPALPVIATQIGTITGLAPGAAARPVNYAITNPNATPAYATAVTISISRIAYTRAAGTGIGTTAASHPAGGGAPGCTAADFAVVAPDALAQNLPAGRTAFTNFTAKKSGTLAMLNTRANQDACKGVTVTLAISVT
jgi:hypothetical protein